MAKPEKEGKFVRNGTWCQEKISSYQILCNPFPHLDIAARDLKFLW